MMRFYYIFLLIQVACAASGGVWTRLSGPNGGEFRSVASAGDSLYAGYYSGDILMSSGDGGATWQRSTARRFTWQDGYPAEIGTILADAQGILYAGKNGGLRIADTIYSIWNSGLYRSTNRGISWGYVNHTITYGTDLTADSEGTIYVASENKIIQLKHLGRSAPEVLYAGEYGSTISCLRVSDEGVLFASVDSAVISTTDKGVTWKKSPVGKRIHRMLLLPGGSVYCATAQGIFRSTHNGDQWELAGLSEHAVFDCHVDASGRLLAATDNGIWRSVSADLHAWELLPATLMQVNTIVQDADGVLYAGTGKGLRYSRDRGERWQSVDGSYFQITSLMLDHRKNLFAGSLGIVRYGLPLNRSSSYTLVATNKVGNGTYGTTGMAVTRGNVMFASIYATILMSTDSGSTWRINDPPFPASVFDALDVFVSRQDELFASYGGSGIHAYSVVNAAWSARYHNDQPKSIQCITQDASGRMYAGNMNGILLSDDGGVSWRVSEPSRLQGAFIQRLVTTPRGEVVAATSRGLFLSSDHGVTWDSLGTIPMDLGFANSPFLSVSAISADTLLVGGLDGSLYRCVIQRTVRADERPFTTGPPHSFLEQNYPNPFNGRTNLTYTLSHRSFVRMTIVDQLGREIVTLVQGTNEPGRHTVQWNSTSASGLYFCRCEVLPERGMGTPSVHTITLLHLK